MIPETPASLPSHFVEHERFAVLEVACIVCIPAHVRIWETSSSAHLVFCKPIPVLLNGTCSMQLRGVNKNVQHKTILYLHAMKRDPLVYTTAGKVRRCLQLLPC